MKRYFYITVNFNPKFEPNEFTLLHDDIYINGKTAQTFRKRPLYDFGWGQENGFELLPQLSFDELIGLVEQPMPKFEKARSRYSAEDLQSAETWKSNLYGAVAVIIQDHVKELIDFLSLKIKTSYFEDHTVKNNFKCFSFSSEKTKSEGKIPGGALTRSYEDILKSYPEWNEISEKVIEQIYG